MSAEKDNCSTGSCHVDKSGEQGSKLVKSTELPLTGNPYPPKDVVQDDKPSSLELSITSARTAIQPYLSPLCTAYSKTNDFISIGIAHSQSAFQGLQENKNGLTNSLVIGGSTVLGLLLARRKGLIKKLFYPTTFFIGSAALLYRDEAKTNLNIAWVMAKNNLPALVSNQYRKLSGQVASSPQSSEDPNKTGSKTD